jgi:hypothetical protein
MIQVSVKRQTNEYVWEPHSLADDQCGKRRSASNSRAVGDRYMYVGRPCTKNEQRLPAESTVDNMS